jgi:hypothetical protein
MILLSLNCLCAFLSVSPNLLLVLLHILANLWNQVSEFVVDVLLETLLDIRRIGPDLQGSDSTRDAATWNGVDVHGNSAVSSERA